MPLRLIHLSDIHFGGENAAAVAAAAAYIRATPFDLLILTGDLTQYGHHAEFAAARAWLASLPGPQLGTPGNHDTPWAGLAERVVAPFKRYARAIGPAWHADFAQPGLAVRAINSARGWQIRLNWSKGEVTRGQANRTGRHFEAMPPGTLRVVACHHPLVEFPGEPMTGRVRGGPSAAKRLTEAGVDMVMTGHLHAPFVKALPFGDERTFAVGAGTLSLRERGCPPSFNVIETQGDQLTVTVMTWKQDALAAEQSWTETLRPRNAVATERTNGETVRSGLPA